MDRPCCSEWARRYWRFQAQCIVIERTQRAGRAIEPERVVLWPYKPAAAIGERRGRELPVGVPQIVGGVHGLNPRGCGLVTHRAAWGDGMLLAARLTSVSQLMLFTVSKTVMPSGLRTNVEPACNGHNPQAASATAPIMVRMPPSRKPSSIAIRSRKPRLGGMVSPPVLMEFSLAPTENGPSPFALWSVD